MPTSTLTPTAEQTPGQEAIEGAGAHLTAARQSLRKVAHHLDASPTRRLHRDTQELMNRADNLLVNLSEWGGGS